MNQTLHIFRKDTRQHWPEILLSLAALSVFAFLAPDQWTFSPEAMQRRSFIGLLLLLIPATWWLLIGRLIHAESLVGDRQFWLTRPYRWKHLLAAKTLSILMWIYVPFVLMLAATVKEAGFSPLGHASGWFHSLAFISGLIILPLIVIAATTENLPRMTVTIFGGIALLIAASYLASMPNGGYESNVPYDHHLWAVELLVLAAIFVVTLQYALRRVWLARAVAIGAIVLATALGVTLTALHDSQINRLYAVSGSAPLQMSQPAERNWLRPVPSERSGMAYVEVPVDFSGVADDHAVQIDDVQVTLDDRARGLHWTAPWWSSRTQRILPGLHHGQVLIMLSRDQLKLFRGTSTTMQLTLALSELQAGAETSAAISPAQDTPVAGFGICSTRWQFPFTQLMCRSPLGMPPLHHVSATWYPKACSDEEKMPNAPLTAAAWSGTPYPRSLEAYAFSLAYGVFPVRMLGVNLYPDWHDGGGLGLCPGTLIHFTQYSVIGRSQVSLTIPNFQLPANSGVE